MSSASLKYSFQALPMAAQLPVTFHTSYSWLMVVVMGGWTYVDGAAISLHLTTLDGRVLWPCTYEEIQ